MLDNLQARTGSEQIEILMLNAVVVIRSRTPAGWRMGAAVEHLGPPLVALLRQMSADLADLATAMSKAGELVGPIPPCPVCSQEIEADPMVCNGCGIYLHRGCREMIQGCTTLDCPHTPDAVILPSDVAAELSLEAPARS
jgi:hypothetical protein